MKTLIAAILTIIILSACGKAQQTKKDFGEFNPYVDSFVVEALARDKHYSYNFTISLVDNLPTTRAGICETFAANLKIPQISINRALWLRFNESIRLELIYHEMGHCVLGRGHNNERIETRAASIMNTNLFNSYVFDYYRQDYVNELFEGAAK